MAVGHPKGAYGVDLYDAACLVLADAEKRYNVTEFTYNPKGAEEFSAMMERILRPPDVAAKAVQSVDALREQMAARAAEKASRQTK